MVLVHRDPSHCLGTRISPAAAGHASNDPRDSDHRARRPITPASVQSWVLFPCCLLRWFVSFAFVFGSGMGCLREVPPPVTPSSSASHSGVAAAAWLSRGSISRKMCHTKPLNSRATATITLLRCLPRASSVVIRLCSRVCAAHAHALMSSLNLETEMEGPRNTRNHTKQERWIVNGLSPAG